MDNDEDGKIDYPADPGCRSADGEDERDRKGTFSCRASALALGIYALGVYEPVVANPTGAPCADDDASLAQLQSGAGTTTVTGRTLVASTELRPDAFSTTLPALADHATGEASAQEVVIRTGVITITATAVKAEASVTCRSAPLVPVLSGESSVATLRIAGVPVRVGTDHIHVPIGASMLHVNHTETGPNHVLQRGLWLDSPDDSQDVVVAEAEADFTETPCS
jgi:hypothetical protein